MTDWEKCVAFHGHECGGLAIGYQAALYAKELLGISFSEDEDIVCISENDACGVDAIQVLLGCTAGKGNLILDIKGKQAFSFYNRKTGKSIRLVLKHFEFETKSASLNYYKNASFKELFHVKNCDAKQSMPEKARIFGSVICENCGESTGDKWISTVAGKLLCRDCANMCSEQIQ